MSSDAVQPPFRTGDHVHHGPTGETWVVAYADPATGRLAWWGWPDGEARISECTLVKRAGDLDHRIMLAELGATGGSRAVEAFRLYGETIDPERRAAFLAERSALQAENDVETAWGAAFCERARRIKAIDVVLGLASGARAVETDLGAAVNLIVKAAYQASDAAGWWNDGKDGPRLLEQPYAAFVVCTKMMLIVSELAEAMEGHRKGRMDDKLPHRPMIEVELADALLRICDLAGALNLDLGGAFVEKRAHNATRADHKLEARAGFGGKKY